MAEPGRASNSQLENIYPAHDSSDKKHRGTKGYLILLVLVSLLGGFSVIFHPVVLHWHPSTSTSSAVFYNIYRAAAACPAQGVPKVSIGSTSELKFTDMSIKFGTFCYTIRATVDGVESPDSNAFEVNVRPTWRH